MEHNNIEFAQIFRASETRVIAAAIAWDEKSDLRDFDEFARELREAVEEYNGLARQLDARLSGEQSG